MATNQIDRIERMVNNMEEIQIVSTPEVRVSIFPDPARNYHEGLLYIEKNGELLYVGYIDLKAMQEKINHYLS